MSESSAACTVPISETDKEVKNLTIEQTSDYSSVENKVILKLIVPSGKSSEFLLPQTYTVGKITEHVYKNWPEDWNEEKNAVTSPHVLRLIYQGRFLHENVTFLALNISTGRKVVMHLVPREKLPQISPDDLEKVPKSSERSCCCTIV